MKPTLCALPCRERPAWRLSYQPENCTSLEVLAALIGGSRQFELAQSVLGRLGSIDALARADPNELLGVEGIGPVTAARLLAAKELGKRIATHHNGDRPVIQSPEDAASLLMPWMQDLEQERLVVLLLDRVMPCWVVRSSCTRAPSTHLWSASARCSGPGSGPTRPPSWPPIIIPPMTRHPARRTSP